jgi:hypothetical protein
MASDGSLADIPRHELVAAALELGVGRPDHLSAEELAEFIRTASSNSVPPRPREPAPSWLAVARNLVASVVEQGLNLPEAARVIRATVRPVPRQRPPLPTVTLAQIYLAQKHTDRAKSTLDQVLQREPDNFKAQSLIARLHAEQRENEQFPSIPPPSMASVPSETSAAVTDAGLDPTAELANAADGLRSANNLVLLRSRDSGQCYLYWELAEGSLLGRSAARATHGSALGIHLSVFAPSARGAILTERWLPLSEPRGVWSVASSSAAEVRAYIGAKLPAGQSKILAVASNYELTAEAHSELATSEVAAPLAEPHWSLAFCPSPRCAHKEAAERAVQQLPIAPDARIM